MADIEVVIKIDEDIYNRFTHNEVRPRCEITEEERFQMDADAVCLTRAFCNGTPFPKGHGRIMDADKIIKKMEEREEKLKDDRSMWETAGVETAIDMFGETIIEADKESEGKQCILDLTL